VVKLLKLKNAGSSGPTYAQLNISDNEPVYYDKNGEEVAPARKGVMFQINDRGYTVVLNGEQVTELIAFLKPHAAVVPTVVPRHTMIEKIEY